MDDGTWICGVLENARFHVQIGMRPGGWDGLVARLLLVGDGCTATDRVRRGELLREVPADTLRAMTIERDEP
jgi:hypothetical protein